MAKLTQNDSVVRPELIYIRKSQWEGNRQNSLH